MIAAISFVMFPDAFFEFGKFPRQFAICFEHLAQLHERAHDRDVHFHSALALQHTREHRDALLGKGIGRWLARPPQLLIFQIGISKISASSAVS